MAAASYFLTGFITAMMIFLCVDYGFPVLLGASVFVASLLCCICVNRTIP